MATIIVIQSSDNVGLSRQDINANFTALNNAKIEADSAATLTNKSFDAAGTGNSISNLSVANFLASALSGADATILTGTPGADGNVVMFNANGDLVDAGVAADAIGSGSFGGISGAEGDLVSFDANGDLQSSGVTASDFVTAGDFVESDTSAVAGSLQITNAIALTQAEYDAIAVPDATTMYLIYDSGI